MKLRLTLLFILLISSINSINAQEYKRALGLRLGYPFSVNGKLFLNQSKAIEGNLAFYSNSSYSQSSIGLALQVHRPLSTDELDGFNWYYGGGVLVGSWNYRWQSDDPNYFYGLQGFLGIEYTFKDVPLNMALDWSPVFSINGYAGFFRFQRGALILRYVLKYE